MPANCIFIGTAPKVAQVDTLTVGGTVEVGDKFHIDMGTKRLTVVAASTVAATVATAIAAAWNALSSTEYPEFAEITALATSGGALTLTADNPGRAFAVTLLTVETNDASADAQTFVRTATTPNSGPDDWSVASNWSTGTVPVTGDTVYFDGSICNGAVKYGLDQNAVTLAALKFRNGWTGSLGLPERNKDTSTTPYDEYRQTELKIGATVIEVDSASARVRINGQAVQSSVVVRTTGTSRETGTAAFQWRGTHASNVFEVRGGSVGIALGATEAATLATFTQTAGSCRCSSGVTLGDINKTGGTLVFEGCTIALVSIRGTLSGDSPIIATN